MDPDDAVTGTPEGVFVLDLMGRPVDDGGMTWAEWLSNINKAVRDASGKDRRAE